MDAAVKYSSVHREATHAALPPALDPVRRLIRAAILSVVTLLVLAGFAVSRQEIAARAAWNADLQAVKVIPPEGQPPQTQESIDLALEMFGIEVPEGVEWPRFDAELPDRGVTVRGAMFDRALVAVGPSAFTSWPLLGSTLAHELEVHCRQSFFFIYVMDMLGLQGTVEAERQAYLHELANAGRFGIDRGSRDLIADTMNYFYPAPNERSVRSFLQHDVRRWMALNLLGTRTDF